MYRYMYIYTYMSMYTENGTNGKQKLPFVCCKWKKHTKNFRLFATNRNGKWKFVFLSRKRINGNR